MSVNRTWKLYETLGLNKNDNPSEREIIKAYRKMALKYHPDKNGGAKWAEDKFKEIGFAYETLSDSAKKSDYDLYGDQTEEDNYSNSYESGGANSKAHDYSYQSYEYKSYYSSFDYDKWKKENDDWWDKFWKDEEEQSKKRKEQWSSASNELEAKWLKEYQESAIDFIEKKLLEKEVSATKLNAQLGVSDWKTKINEITDWTKVNDKKWHLYDIITLLGREFTCDNCGKTRNDLYFPRKSGGKIFCDWDCQDTYEKKHDKNDDNANPDKKFTPFEEEKEICEKCFKKFPASEMRLGDKMCRSCQRLKDNQEIKDEIRKPREFFEQKDNKKDNNNEKDGKGGVHYTKVKSQKNPLWQLLDWMKKEGVVAFSFRDNKLIIEFEGQRTETLADDNLTSEQAELKNYFQQNPTAKQSISRSELESGMLGSEGNTEVNPEGNKTWIAPVAVIVVALVVFLIGIMVYKSSKKEKRSW